MRILILGGAGMLGHQLLRQLRHQHELWVTLRKPVSYYDSLNIFERELTLDSVDVLNEDALQRTFRIARPDAVVNCIGIVKQLEEAKNPLSSIAVNSLLPHRLSQLCAVAGARMVHISTDCVFSGRAGYYSETDISDAEDLYGRTKFLGEVHDEHCVTLRTSIVGRELETRSGLIEWFLSQQGKTIKGFQKAIYSGFTTMEMARIIERILTGHPEISGLWQVASDPISKYDLLKLAKESFGWKGEIIPDDEFVCDRSMNASRFGRVVGYQPPQWNEMIGELANPK